MARVAPALLLLASLAARPVAAQRSTVATADSLAAAGDTSAAMALLDRAVRDDRKDAAAWHRRGMLAWSGARSARAHGSAAFIHSQRAISLLQEADSSLRMADWLAPDSGRFALDLGKFFLNGSLITLRVQAPGKFARALDAARRTGDHALAAEALDERGMVYWRRFEAVEDRRGLRGVQTIQPQMMVSDVPHATENFLENFTIAYPEPAGMADYIRATDDFQAALKEQPASAVAAHHAMMALADRKRWEELSRAAHDRIAAAPGDAQAWLALGLALHRMDRDPEAAPAFDSALARLDAPERARLTRLTRLLRPKDSASTAALSAPRRAELERVYWTLSDPSTLTPENEHWLEFLSRVTYAELRWTSDDLDRHGADTDRGDIWIRYGPPPVVASFAPSGDGVKQCGSADESAAYCGADVMPGVGFILWYYPSLDLGFVFQAPPSYGTASLALDYESVAEEARAAAPVSWANVPIDRTMDTVPVQVARFRAGADGDSTDVALFARIPIRRMSRGIDLASGPVDVVLSLYDSAAHRLARDSARQVVRFAAPDAAEARAWRRRLTTGTLYYRVEALQPDAARAARATGTVQVRPAHGFGMSDLLVAERVMPRDSATAARWTDMIVTPSSGTLRSGQDLGLVWETYDLGAKDGTSRYRVQVELTVLEVTRPAHLLARVLGGAADALGLSARGDDQVALGYERQRGAQPVALDYLTLSLDGAPAGRYRLAVRVTDLVTGQSTVRTRELRVVE